MTATRIWRVATLAVAVVVWVAAASLLWRTKVPANLRLPSLDERSIFGAAVVREAQRYERFLSINWVLGTIAGLAALVWMVRRGPRIAESLRLGSVNAGIILGAVTLTLAWAVSLPFGLASEWWQRRHGISTEDYGSALGLAWGGLLVTILVGFVILAGLLLLAKKVGAWWWLAATPLLVALFASLQLALPYVLTLDTHPLRDPKLVAQIRDLERREDAGNPPIREQDVSDQTTAANAYSVGIGPSERVVFWNTLLDGRFTDREVRFVAAHELAHLARDHILKSVAWFTLFLLPILGIAAFLTERRGGLRNAGTVPLLLLTIVAVQLVALPLRNAITRRYEAEADWVALIANRDPSAARGLFRQFAHTSLQDPSPPWWAHVLLDDHPTSLDRIEQAAAWRSRNP
jgi:Zn-dependent protease with chaperone function